MTAQPGTLSASMDVPHSQNTAPVLEFRCLYTADIRRKQKRWQDGRVKFHTFNKRVMVYDEKSNFVGDTHWKGGLEFEEGEELELDRGGILVEVGECIGKRDQDLTELVDKRVKDREERVAAKVAASPSASLYRGQSTPAGTALLRAKPLNVMLTPSGHYGRAVMPATSPFEERQATKRDENEPPPKKRRQNDVTSSRNGYAQNLLGATLSLSSSKPSSTPTIRYEPFKARPVHPPSSEAIDLTLDDDEERKASDLRRRKAQEQRAAIERPPPRQKKSKRSPPSKSGYASSLTGTPLMLSRSDVRPLAKTMVTKAPVQQYNLDSEGSESEIESSVRVQSAAKSVLQKVPKPAVLQPREEDVIQFSDSEHSSPGLFLTPEVVKAVRKSKAPSPQVDLEAERDSSSEGENFVEIEAPPEQFTKPIKKSKETLAYKRRLEQGFSTTELDSSQKRPPKKRQKEVSAAKPIRPSKATPVVQSRSSSSQMEYATPHLDHGGSFNRSAMQKSSAVESTSERPRSALRIKSRPARQMMMLMSRPSPRPSASSTSFESSRPNARTQRKSVDASKEVVLSQATVKLNAFCANQQAELDARLKCIASEPDFGEDFGEAMSSDADVGIDHQTIDILLARKVQPVQHEVEPVRTAASRKSVIEERQSIDQTETLATTTSTTSSKRGSPDQMDASSPPKQVLPSKVMTVEDEDDEHPRLSKTAPVREVLISNDIRSVPGIISHVNEQISLARQSSLNSQTGIAEIPEKQLMESTKQALSVKEISLLQDLDDGKTTELQRSTLKFGETEHVTTSRKLPEEKLEENNSAFWRAPSPKDTPMEKQPPAQAQTKPVGVTSPSEDNSAEQTTPNPPTPQDKQQSPFPQALQVTPRKDTWITSSSMQLSTPRFLAMISPSSDSKNPASIFGPKSPYKQPTVPQLHTSHSFEEQPQPPTSEPVAIPPTVTKSFSSIEGALHDRPVPGQGFSSAGISASTSAVASAARSLSTPDLAADISSKTGTGSGTGSGTGIAPPLPRPRLANPATRGKSLQTLAASTVDSMNPLPLFNPMPPPAAGARIGGGTLTRVDRSTLRDGRDVEREERERALVNEKLPVVPADGPWSREAWDLFGWSGPEVVA